MSDGSSQQNITQNQVFSLAGRSEDDDSSQLEASTEREAPLNCTFCGVRASTDLGQGLDDTPFGYAELQAADDNRTNGPEQWDMNYLEASIYLEEGENNDKFNFHPRSKDALPVYKLVHNKYFYCLDLLAAVTLLSLALMEKPAVPGFALNEWVHASIELLCLSVMGAELAIKMRWMGRQSFFQHKRSMIKLIVLVIMVIEALIVLGRQSSHVRVTRALRPVFLIDNHYCKGIRRVIRQIIQSLPPILDMLTLLLFFMLIFSVLGFYLFSGIKEDTYFSSLAESFVSLFVLLTTANFPDVMMPSYAVSKWSSLFFIIFIIIHVYFLMNLMLAVVYETFTRIEKDKFRKLLLHRRKACQLAFRLLVTKTSPLQMTFRHFEGLMRYFKPKNCKKCNYLLFKTLDMDKTGYLSMDEFYNIFEGSPLQWKTKRSDELWFAHMTGTIPKILQKIHDFVLWPSTDFFINVVISANGIWQVLEAAEVFGPQNKNFLVYKNPDYMIPQDIYGWASVGFVTFYTFEASLKILGLGFHEYLSSRWDRYDFVVTILGICGLIAEQFHFPFAYIIILRPLRLLRLFKLKKRYRDVLGTLFIILPRFLSVGLVLAILYYFFGIIGMEVLSGYDLVNCCQNTTVEQFYHFENDSAIDGYYYLNNFDDFISSQITLFELMVVNNWFIIMDGYAVVVTEWTRLFFMCFYVVTMVVINIVVAFVLEAFLFRIQYKRMSGDMDKESLVKVDIGLTQDELAFCGSPLHFSKSQMALFANSNSDLVIYRGTRTRTKFSFSLKMYSEEVKKWMKQADEEEELQREILLSRLQQEAQNQRQITEEEYHQRTCTI